MTHTKKNQETIPWNDLVFNYSATDIAFLYRERTKIIKPVSTRFMYIFIGAHKFAIIQLTTRPDRPPQDNRFEPFRSNIVSAYSSTQTHTIYTHNTTTYIHIHSIVHNFSNQRPPDNNNSIACQAMNSNFSPSVSVNKNVYPIQPAKAFAVLRFKRSCAIVKKITKHGNNTGMVNGCVCVCDQANALRWYGALNGLGTKGAWRKWRGLIIGRPFMRARYARSDLWCDGLIRSQHTDKAFEWKKKKKHTLSTHVFVYYWDLYWLINGPQSQTRTFIRAGRELTAGETV